MEASATNSDMFRAPAGTSNSRRYGILSASNVFQAPLSALLEYTGILRSRSNYLETESLISNRLSSGARDHVHSRLEAVPNDGELSIRIIGAGEQVLDREANGLAVGQVREVLSDNEVALQSVAATSMPTTTLPPTSESLGDSRAERLSAEGISQSVNVTADAEAGDGVGANGRDSSYQRYDIQQAARWIEQVLPFSLLLLVVFIRQHLQGSLPNLNLSLL